MTRVLIVSGSRHATDEHRGIIGAGLLAAVNGEPHAKATLLVHGAARGVDTIAAQVAKDHWAWDVEPFPAKWHLCDTTTHVELGGCPQRPHLKNRGGRTYCPFAGFRRNQAMLDAYPDAAAVLCFPSETGGVKSGTGDFIDRAIRAGFDFSVHPLRVERSTTTPEGGN